MTPYQIIQTLLARRPMAMPELLEKTGMPRKTLHRCLNELIHDQKTIQRAARGVYAAVPAPTAASGGAGQVASVESACVLASAGAGGGQVGALGRAQGCSACAGAWAGQGHGIRGPGNGETALSDAEVALALMDSAQAATKTIAEAA